MASSLLRNSLSVTVQLASLSLASMPSSQFSMRKPLIWMGPRLGSVNASPPTPDPLSVAPCGATISSSRPGTPTRSRYSPDRTSTVSPALALSTALWMDL
jgi:hypothetical protein